MKKILLLLFTVLLAGCGSESISGTFTLEAAQGFVNHDNTETPHTYVIESDTNQVYVDTYSESFTDEELEAFRAMSAEERAEYFENQPIAEEPLYDLTVLEATKDEIILEYEDERVIFTALSDSYFKTEDGTQYVIEYNSLDIQDYLNSFRVD